MNGGRLANHSDWEDAALAPASASHLHGSALVSVLAALAVMLALEALDQTIVGRALPAIVGALQSSSGVTSVITAYLVASTAMVALVTLLARRYEPRWFLIVGAIVFALGSALCGVARTMDQLVAFRAVQALGAGTGFGVTLMALGDIFRPPQRAWWQALFVCIFGLCSAVGPIIGGWLADHGPLVAGMITDGTRWRWIFLVNLPVSLIALAALVISFPAAVSGPHQPSPKDA